MVIIPISVFLYRSKSIMHKDFNTVSGLKKNIQSLLSSTVIIFFFTVVVVAYLSVSLGSGSRSLETELTDLQCVIC